MSNRRNRVNVSGGDRRFWGGIWYGKHIVLHGTYNRTTFMFG